MVNQISIKREFRGMAFRNELLARGEYPNHRRLLRERLNHYWDILQKGGAGGKGPNDRWPTRTG